MQGLQKGCLLRNSLEYLLGAHQAVNLHTPSHIVNPDVHQQVHKTCLRLSYNHSSCNLSEQEKCMGRFEIDTASCKSIEVNNQSARSLRHTVRECTINPSSLIRVQSYLLMLVLALPVMRKKPASSAVPAGNRDMNDNLHHRKLA